MPASNPAMLFAALKLSKSLFSFGEICRQHRQTMLKVGAAGACRIADIGQIEIWSFIEKLYVCPCEVG